MEEVETAARAAALMVVAVMGEGVTVHGEVGRVLEAAGTAQVEEAMVQVAVARAWVAAVKA